MGLIPASIRHRLLGVTVVTVLTIVVVHDIVSVVEVRRLAVAAATSRLESVSGQLSTMMETQARQMRSQLAANALLPEVHAFLRDSSAPARDTVRALLQRKLISTVVGASVWGPQGNVLMSVGTRPAVDAASARTLLAAAERQESATGELIVLHDSLIYPTVARVSVGARSLGAIVEWRRFTRSPEGRRQLLDLIGSRAELLTGNAVGEGWTDFARIVRRPPGLPSLDGPTPVTRSWELPGEGRQLAAFRPIGGTPWILVVAFPHATVVGPVRTAIVRLTASTILLLLAGTAVAWWLGSRLTTPLRDLAAAAADISGGDYARRVAVSGSDEVAALATSFNHMAHSVSAAQPGSEDGGRGAPGRRSCSRLQQHPDGDLRLQPVRADRSRRE